MSTWASWLVIVSLMGLTALVVLVGERSHWWLGRRAPRPLDYEIDFPEFAKRPDEHTHIRVTAGYRPLPPPEPDSL